MNTDRLETIKSFFKERRGEVEELFLNSPDYELTESGLFTKYAFELVDFISSPNAQEHTPNAQ